MSDLLERRGANLPQAGLGRLNILLVEDDDNDVNLLRLAFRKSPGLHMDVVYHGREAIDKLLSQTAAHWPGLIVCDLNMPVMNGFEFITWLKRESPCPRIPLVVLTSSMVETDLAKAYDLGAAAYLVKPSSHTDLQALAKALADFWKLVYGPPLKREM